MMTAADEKQSEIQLQTTSPTHHDRDTKDALISKPPKYWYGSNFLRAVNACDKFFNCAYVKFQLEEELMEENKPPMNPTGSIERLLRSMDQGVEVEVYRQFLFEENGLEPCYEESYHHPDRRDSGILERPQDQETRTSEQE